MTDHLVDPTRARRRVGLLLAAGLLAALPLALAGRPAGAATEPLQTQVQVLGGSSAPIVGSRRTIAFNYGSYSSYSGLALSLSRPDGVDLVPGSLTSTAPGSACTVSATSIDCDVPGIAPGQLYRIYVDARFTSEGTKTFTGTAATTDGPVASPTSAATTVVAPQPVDLALTKEASDPRPAPGAEVHYLLRPTFAGPTESAGAVIRDDFPAGATFVAGSLEVFRSWDCAADATGLTCTQDGATGAPFTIGYRLTMPTATGPATNTATITDVDDTDPGNDTATATVDVGGLDPSTDADVTVAPGQPAGTHPVDGQTPDDPIGTTITSPTGGSVTVSEAPTSTPPAAGYQTLGQVVQIEAPPATAAQPLEIAFDLDASALTGGATVDTVDIFRNGAPIAACTGPAGKASPDPCVTSRTTADDGDIRITVLTSHASTWSFGVVAPTLQAGKATYVRGESATLTLTVPTRARFPKATGQAVFDLGSGGEVTVPVVGGRAVLKTRLLPVGTTAVQASYTGGPGYAASSTSLVVEVVRGATTTTPAARATAIGHGRAAALSSLTKRVAPATGGSLAGWVTFTATSASGDVVSATVLAGTTGSAQWRPKLGDGDWTIESAHLGNDGFEGSTGGPITVHVGP